MPLNHRRGKILLATRNEMVTVPLVLEEIAEAIHGLKQLGWSLDVVIVDDSDEAGYKFKSQFIMATAAASGRLLSKALKSV